MRRVWSLVLAAAFCAACAVVAAIALGPPPQGLAPGEDKLHHFVAFLALTVLGAAAFSRMTPLAPAFGLLAGGVAIELLQGLPAIARSPSLGDLAADAAGVGLGLALVGVARACLLGLARLTGQERGRASDA